MNELRALETCIVTGAVFLEPASQKSVTVTETIAAIESAFYAVRHTPRHLKSLGRDTLRLRVEPEMRAAYRGLERLFERHRPAGMTFLRFACLALIDTHAHELPNVAYRHIYSRDGLRCTNPLCKRFQLQASILHSQSRKENTNAREEDATARAAGQAGGKVAFEPGRGVRARRNAPYP